MSRKPAVIIQSAGADCKVCTVCGELKALTLYYAYSDGKRHARCCECAKKYMRSWWRKNNAPTTKRAKKGSGAVKEGDSRESEGSMPSAVPIGGEPVRSEPAVPAGPSEPVDVSRRGTSPVENSKGV